MRICQRFQKQNFIKEGKTLEPKSLGELISDYLKANKMSQEQFAVEVGVTGRMIRWYIQGLRTPTGNILAKICKKIDIDIRKIKL